MTGKIILHNSNKYECYYYQDYIDDNMYVIEIYTDLSNKYNNLINKNLLLKSIKDNIIDNKYIDKFTSYTINNIDNLFDNITCIYFSNNYDIKDINNYINNNNLDNINIYIDIRNIKDINKYLDNKDNIYVFAKNNIDYVKYSDYLESQDKLNNIIKDIKLLNLSPLESIIYIYDLVRCKKYNEETIIDDASVSRNATDVILNDKIVCVGYCNYLTSLLDLLNIKARVVYFYQESHIHAREEIYISDPKYNLDGVYYFDPTFDSEDLNKYNYFGLTLSSLYNKDKLNNNYIFNSFPIYEDNFINNLINVLNSNNTKLITKYLISINHMVSLIKGIDNYINIPLFKDIDINTLDKDNIINIARYVSKYFYIDNDININIKDKYHK